MPDPFVQGRFADLPERPRIPHGFFDTEALEVRVETPELGPMSAHVRRHGSGPPLLLIHGLMTTSYSWRYALEPLGAHFTCYAPDLPGTGRSDKPLHAAYDPATLGRWIGALQNALGIDGCKTIGNSMGGYLCMHLALDDPKAFEKLLVLHAPGIPDVRYYALRSLFRLPGTEAFFHWLVRRKPLEWAHRNVHYYDESLKSLEEAREYGEPLRDHDGCQAFMKYLRETMGIEAVKRFDTRLRARRPEPFGTPLLLLYARQDPMVPPRVGRELARLIPSAELRWLDGASHFAHVDGVDAFAQQALTFLKP